MERIGYYFRSRIVQEAADALGGISAFLDGEAQRFTLTEVDTIPETQEEINKQADACLRDLFPRMPATDREQIIEQSFNRENSKNPRTGEVGVGLTKNLPLAKRCQLATNAHIRHIHTNYDKLLREYEYLDCRKAVEPICLEKIMEWRGDEETGRDQLDEILREIVVIPDSDDEDDELQFLGQVHNIPSRTPSPPKPASPSQRLVPYAPPRPFRSSATNIHPDDPRYGDWVKEQKKRRREEAISKVKNGKKSKKKKKRSMAEKESRKNFHRYQLFQQTSKRQGGNAASAGDGHHDNDENRHKMHRDYEQQQYNPGMDRQPLQDARYVQPFQDGNEMPMWRQDVRGHIPTGCENSGRKRKLAHMLQESDHYQARDSLLEQRRLLRQFVDQRGRLVREYENPDVQRQPQCMHAPPQQQYHPEQQRRITRAAMAPLERRDIIPSIERSIEAIDLTDSPARPLRPASPYLVEHPRGVVTMPQPQRKQVMYRPVQQSEPEYHAMPDQEVVYVQNGPDFVPQRKRRRIYQQSEEPIRVKYRGQPLPSSQRVDVVDPQPDTRRLGVERHLDPSQPIVISSSPLSQSIPAPVGAAPRLAHRTQQRSKHEFDDIFQHENQLQAQQRGASSAKRQRVVSEQEYHGNPQEQYGQGPLQGQMTLVNHHAAYPFPVPSTHGPPVRAPVSQAPQSAYFEDGRAGLVEEIPVVNQYGERLGVKPVSVKNARHQMAGGEPLYARQANEHPTQTEYAQPQPQRPKPKLAHQITGAQPQQQYVVRDYEAEEYADGGLRGGQHSQDYQRGSRHVPQHRPMPLRTRSELDQRQRMGGYCQGQSIQPHHARQPSATKYPEFMDDDGTQWFRAADGSVLPVMRPRLPTQAPQSGHASTMQQASGARYRQPCQMPQQYQQHGGPRVQNGHEQSRQPTWPLSGYKKGRRMPSYRNEGVIMIDDSP